MPELLAWTAAAWQDYLYWQSEDRKTLSRINRLVQACVQNPRAGLGKPEALKGDLSGFWSRRIDHTNRLVYAVDDKTVTIISCRYHY
jgi:toxin YoeB